MRKLIVCNIISLDGFYSGPGGNVLVMPFGAGFSDSTRSACEPPIRCCSGARRTRVSDPIGLELPTTRTSQQWSVKSPV
jgi:hypothetical protein